MFLAFCFLLFSELKKTKVDLETLKSQATSTNNEYDRLLKEHEKLQVSCMQTWGGSSENPKKMFVYEIPVHMIINLKFYNQNLIEKVICLNQLNDKAMINE